jgi:hypothetical protein
MNNENKIIAGTNKNQTVNESSGRILLFGSAQPTQKYEAKGGFTGGYAPNGGNLGFPTDDQISRNGMTENIKISDEQRIIFEHIKAGKNVIVDSIAGSGKSTTIINIAQLMPDKLFLHVTYNSMLRKEFKQKVVSLNLTNIEVHTYHSLAVKYFHPTAFTDTGIREILALNILPVCELPPFDIVVLDECQDMTRLYYNFTRLVVSLISKETHINDTPKENANANTNANTDGNSACIPPPQLLFLGDYKQCLYEFKGADWRYLTLADKIWSSLPHYPPESFVHCSLKTSYRITNQMSSFVNNVMLGEYRMNACREGAPVIYIRNTRFNLERIIIHHIKRILDEGDLPSDIFILAPSVKGSFSNVRRLENVLVESGIPCHVPMFENERISDEKVINGKIVFSTFHSVKGRQRKYVFVMNFDNSYFTYNARNMDSTVCPNTLYVATTRATHQLYLLEINSRPTDRPLEFLRMSHSQMSQTDYIDFKGRPQSVFYEEVKNPKDEDKIPVHRVTPTDIIKFLPESVLEKITPILKRIIKPVVCSSHSLTEDTNVSSFIPEIDVPSIVYLKNGLYEDVTDLNGVAIPAIYCDYIQRKANNKHTNTNTNTKTSTNTNTNTKTSTNTNTNTKTSTNTNTNTHANNNDNCIRGDSESENSQNNDMEDDAIESDDRNGIEENERIAGANKSQIVDEGWGRRGNLGFPTDDRIFLNGMKENEPPNILWRFIKNTVEQFKEGEHLYLKRIFQSLSPSCKTPAQYLYMSNVYIAFQEKLYFKLKQIDEDEYNWLTDEMMEQCNQRIDRIVCGLHQPRHPYPCIKEEANNNDIEEIERSTFITSPSSPTPPPSPPLENNFVFENTFIHYSQDDKHALIDQLLRPHLNKVELYRFTARLDLITDRNVWELKFVSELTIEHYLQFVIYAWLWKCVYHDDPVQSVKEFKIFNIRKEEVFTLTASLKELTKIVALIIKSKYDSFTPQNEKEFLGSL